MSPRGVFFPSHLDDLGACEVGRVSSARCRLRLARAASPFLVAGSDSLIVVMLFVLLSVLVVASLSALREDIGP